MWRAELRELWRLALPAIGSRLGLIGLGFVDTVLVGRFATRELAALSLANRAAVLVLIVVSIGLLMGVIVATAQSHGRGDPAATGRVWRRSMPYAFALGLLMAAVAAASPLWMPALAGDEALVARAARLAQILAIGIPGHLLFFTCGAFLEGIKRPVVPMTILALANLLNLLLDWVLIYGLAGLPALGAEGAAWASTILRWTMAAAAAGYILLAPSMRPFAVRQAGREPWRAWAHQRALGYASAVSIAAEVGAFAGLALIAERLGAAVLAGQEIAINLLTLPFMLAVGLGSASAVTVGAARGRGDQAAARRFGLLGLFSSMAAAGAAGLVIAALAEPLFFLHSRDAALAAITIPALLLIAAIAPFDGGQATISMALRGLGETWWPTAIQMFSYLGVMLPLAILLALDAGRGLVGLMEAVLAASVVSVLLQTLRFLRAAAR
ncbi:MAG: multidrug efflux MATE transporter NorM [Rhodothalassiaceae bacterium]|nr:MAG: multidrug efflux MATE transporter NorM [Rhodothalassiaceae bacterium]